MSEILIGQCGKVQEGQIHINKKSDFPLSLKLVKDGKTRKMVWLWLLTLKHLSRVVLAFLQQVEREVSLTIVKSRKTALLTVFFDNHNLTAGQLQIEVVFYHVDSDYNTDGIRQEAFNVASNVYLVNDNGNAVSLEMPAPQIVEKRGN